MDSQEIFIDEIDALPPAEFLAHFLTGRIVACPALPKATRVNLLNAQSVLKNRFDINGETHVLPQEFSWKPNPSRDKEWQIAHHKFYFLIDLILAYKHTRDEVYLRKWMTLLESWLDEMEPGYITLSDAQVEAKRIESWVHSFLLLGETPCRSLLTPGFLRRFLERIATETWYISEHLKPVRNHRTFQLFSVFLVGVLFPEFRLHSYFLQMGKEELTKNLLTDFLPDGVHVELSTHYHQLVLETALSFVELARSNGIVMEEALLSRLSKALNFSMFMQWPNGDIPLVNDSDNGDHLELLRRGSRLFKDDQALWAGTLGRQGIPPNAPSRHFEHSGYFIFSDGWGRGPATYGSRQHVFYDCAALGEGSHSHYDLFSFCYYANGQALIVDPGRYTYSSDPDLQGVDWRREFKSTAYHNTVTIDQRDQTRYLNRTKHGPEVEILEKDFHLGTRSDWVSAKARSAEYTPLHERLFVYMHRQYLFILDHIQSDDGKWHECVLRFHLSEDETGRASLEARDREFVVRSQRFHIRSYRPSGLRASIESGWVSEQYGVKTAAPVVAMAQAGSEPLLFCSLVVPGGAQAPKIEIRSLDLLTSPAARHLLFRVEGRCAGESFHDHFVFQRGEQPETFQAPGITFRGRFLAFRQDHQGKVTHLFSRKAEQIDFAAGPHFSLTEARNLEWPC